MRTIILIDSDADKARFEYMYRGLIIGGHIVQTKGLMVLKRELSVLNKLDSISVECPCGRLIPGTQERDRELTGGDFKLEDAEFDLLFNYISSIPWSTGKALRGAIATLDWLRDGDSESDRS